MRVAISGDNLICNEDDFYGDRNPARLFAKVEYGVDGEAYLAYRHPQSLIGKGLPAPAQMAEAVITIADNLKKNELMSPTYQEWIIVDKRQVPHKFRSLLGKVMSRVQNGIDQGPEFFQDPKAR